MGFGLAFEANAADNWYVVGGDLTLGLLLLLALVLVLEDLDDVLLAEECRRLKGDLARG